MNPTETEIEPETTSETVAEPVAEFRPLGPKDKTGNRLSAELPPLDSITLESVALNLEASLRIYTNHHFFSWTQGLLQNLIRHEVLICSSRKGAAEQTQVESFSTANSEPGLFSQLYRQDASFTERLIKQWEANYFQPVVYSSPGETTSYECPLIREFSRIGADKIIAHGTHDASAKMTSFFVFACSGKDTDADAFAAQARRVEMLVPFLHAAWMRTKIGLSANSGQSPTHPVGRDLLTRREQEVLKWVYMGKSNIEIGLILGISPLTVKNHVQEILRRLNVQNRTQAVGKAFNLHILTC